MHQIGRLLRGFGRFWYDFIIGDDPKIALAVLLVLTVGGVLAGPAGVSSRTLTAGLAALLLLAFATVMAVDVRRAGTRVTEGP